MQGPAKTSDLLTSDSDGYNRSPHELKNKYSNEAKSANKDIYNDLKLKKNAFDFHFEFVCHAYTLSNMV